jgi:hypothetical protein
MFSRRRDEDHRYLPTRVIRPDDRRLRDCCDRPCRRDRHIVPIPFHRGLLPAVLVSEHLEEPSEALSAPLSIQSRGWRAKQTNIEVETHEETIAKKEQDRRI